LEIKHEWKESCTENTDRKAKLAIVEGNMKKGVENILKLLKNKGRKEKYKQLEANKIGK
jgi:hypothetical protein